MRLWRLFLLGVRLRNAPALRFCKKRAAALSRRSPDRGLHRPRVVGPPQVWHGPTLQYRTTLHHSDSSPITDLCHLPQSNRWPRNPPAHDLSGCGAGAFVVSFFGCKILGFTTAQSGQTFGTFKSEGGGEWGNPALTIQPPSPPHRVSARARSVAIPLHRLVVSQLNRFLYVYECASHASRVYQGATSTGTRQFIEELAEVPPCPRLLGGWRPSPSWFSAIFHHPENLSDAFGSAVCPLTPFSPLD